ncbi:MAG: T9SS type A sorting domain-containing protein [Flavobacteriales bacterium]|nr:T9SS type A sorting domain-containing protein [Flavobacteriales bacterium]
MKIILSVAVIFYTASALSQFEIGHTAISFYDSSRDRDVTTEIYYPSESTGDDVVMSNGTFPLIVFGHGFVMPWSDYENIWTHLVEQGYVMAFATTEGGFFPNHENFGLDLAFIVEAMMDESINGTSIFYNHLNDKQAIMGHSMGGGASWLAASGNDEIETIVGLAPAETSPSAISAANDVIVPALLLSGSADAVTPSANHHTPIYENTASDCKAFVNIIDGGHCGYADDGTLCDIGEIGFSGMSREVQQEITHELLSLWFGYYLKNVSENLAEFENYFDNSVDTELTSNCSFVSVVQTPTSSIWEEIRPNPALEYVQVNNNESSFLTIINSTGIESFVFALDLHDKVSVLDISRLPSGVYFARWDNPKIETRKLIVLDY